MVECMFRADSLELLIVVDNWVDMLLADRQEAHQGHACVTRWGLIEHFDNSRLPPQAENGISLLAIVRRDDRVCRILFDVGLTGSVLLHNLAVFGEEPRTLDYIVISHGHPDHYGGIYSLLGAADRQLPVVTHPDAFLPRFAIMADGRSSGFYNRAFNPGALGEAKAATVLTRDAVDLGWGVVTTGEIPRDSSFEGPRAPESWGVPGLYRVSREGKYGLDEVWDEQGLVIDVAGEGLVVLTGCGHAGVINTVNQARAVLGDRPVRAVVGGFHLGFPTTPSENVEKTTAALRELEVKSVVPMHCSGLAAHQSLVVNEPERYVQPAVGSRLYFGKRV